MDQQQKPARPDVIHVERNPAEELFLNLRNWWHRNPALRKRIQWILAAVILLVVTGFTAMYLLADKQSADFYKLAVAWERKTRKPAEVAPDAIRLCNSFLVTDGAALGCLLAAATLTENSDFAAAIPMLEKYADHAIAAHAAFARLALSTIASSAGQFDTSRATLEKIRKTAKTVSAEDVILLEIAKAAYFSGDKKSAKETLENLLRDYPSSPAANQARQMLILLAAR